MERLKGHPISHEVRGGYIAHQVAFSDEGQLICDSTDLARERHLNRVRQNNPGYMKYLRPFSGNQAIYDKVAASNRKSFAAAGRPRGYSKDYWNTISRANSTKKRSA